MHACSVQLCDTGMAVSSEEAALSRHLRALEAEVAYERASARPASPPPPPRVAPLQRQILRQWEQEALVRPPPHISRQARPLLEPVLAGAHPATARYQRDLEFQALINDNAALAEAWESDSRGHGLRPVPASTLHPRAQPVKAAQQARAAENRWSQLQRLMPEGMSLPRQASAAPPRAARRGMKMGGKAAANHDGSRRSSLEVRGRR